MVFSPERLSPPNAQACMWGERGWAGGCRAGAGQRTLLEAKQRHGGQVPPAKALSQVLWPASSRPAAHWPEVWVLPISWDDSRQVTSPLHASLSPPVKQGQRFHNRCELQRHPPPAAAAHKRVCEGVLCNKTRVWLSPLLTGATPPRMCLQWVA